jgi:hypothetical protein
MKWFSIIISCHMPPNSISFAKIGWQCEKNFANLSSIVAWLGTDGDLGAGLTLCIIAYSISIEDMKWFSSIIIISCHMPQNSISFAQDWVAM